MIQSTIDGKTCLQKAVMNDENIWQQTIQCPAKRSEIQHIYAHGRDSRTADAEIRNFQFLTFPL